MAFLKADITYNIDKYAELLQDAFPDIKLRFLALIGTRIEQRLKSNYLSGQELDLRTYPADKLGRRTLRNDVNKRRTQVKVYSYPVNLFEKGRGLRGGGVEPGKFIITRKLKDDTDKRLDLYVKEAEEVILKPVLKKIGF